jgi:NAD(P)-dependent dehydrogenase (short-subunit alcohol dehydrogenase family)
MISPASLFDLTGRTALITGAAGGLGTVFAHALAGAGAAVALVGRRVEPLARLAADVAAASGRPAVALAADVTDEAAVYALVGAATAALGPVDILVNSAGINIRRPGVDYDLADWQRVLQVNLTGPFLCARAFAPAMLARGWGRVINVSSMLGQVGLAERSAYTATKGGLLNLSRTLALEWAGRGVTVNTLAPGPFMTELNRPLLNNPAAYQAFVDRIPLGRWGEPDELAGPILFLASPASSFMTGAVLTVDGGWTAQ